MILLGVVLLILGSSPRSTILWTIGMVLGIVGVILVLLGASGRAVGGRKHYF